MNFPSTMGSNWMWRVDKNKLTDELAKKIYKFSEVYGRCEGNE